MTPTSRVLVVRTVHSETGNATAAELHWLLGRLRPDVVFLEHSATEVATYPYALSDSLELAAVMRYREQHSLQLVPVGLDVPDAAQLKPAFEAMIARVEEANPRYREMEMAYYEDTARGGLAFLNSPASALLQEAKQREFRATLDALADPVLADVYELWTRVNHLRESAMLRGVEEFAHSNPFRRGVLLVGAAHWQPVVEQSRKRSTGCSHSIAWDFEWELDVGDHPRTGTV
jgi:hypothetical protein